MKVCFWEDFTLCERCQVYQNHLNYPGIEPANSELLTRPLTAWATGADRCTLFLSHFTLLNGNTPRKKYQSSLEPTTSKLLIQVSPCWANRTMTRKSLSELFTCSSEQQLYKESRFKPTTPRPAHQIPECPAFDSFIWRTVFKTQTDSRIKLTTSELHDSPPTHWATWTSGVWTWTLVCVLFCALFLQTVDVRFFCFTFFFAVLWTMVHGIKWWHRNIWLDLIFIIVTLCL